jgi:hypothetical protein
MKSLLTAVIVLNFTTIACTDTDEGHQANQSENESSRPGGGSAGETNNKLPAVTGLTASATGPTEIKLAWDSVPNATTYWIYRDGYVPAIVPYTNYTDKAVSPGTTYPYAIAAVVNSTLGPKSATVTVTTPR